jgi:hypothetical protein
MGDLEFREREPAGSFDLYDHTGKVGEIEIHHPATDVDRDGARRKRSWFVNLWLPRPGEDWEEDCDTVEAAKKAAQEMYLELVAERREAGGPRSVYTMPVPMGGQRRR